MILANEVAACDVALLKDTKQTTTNSRPHASCDIETATNMQKITSDKRNATNLHRTNS